jgi:hypothetical protein
VGYVQTSEILHVHLWLRRPVRVRRRRLREQADHWIERGYDDPVDSLVAWRVQELTSERERHRLSRSMRGVVKSLSGTWLPGASPVNRVALRPYATLLAATADRLAETEYAVSAAGVLEVRRMLSDPDGPLYARPDDPEAADVGGALRTMLRGLEP